MPEKALKKKVEQIKRSRQHIAKVEGELSSLKKDIDFLFKKTLDLVKSKDSKN